MLENNNLNGELKATNRPCLSLCIPTNGVIEWVVPVLDSIYEQEADQNAYEVIVTDNGNNQEFYTRMQEYEKKHENFTYKKTDAKQFLNQIEAFKLAKGYLIKFINHRMKLLPGAVQYLLEFTVRNAVQRPGIYFLNEAIKNRSREIICNNFNEYIKNLSFFSSWSAGIAIWKEDFENIDLDKPFNLLFPHINILISERKKLLYIIDNTKLLETIPVSSISKGSYDLFFAFSVEYIDIMLGLVKDRDISIGTFLKIKKETGKFIAQQYMEFVLQKKPCSYNLDSFETSVNVFFSVHSINRKAQELRVKSLIKKLIGKK